MESYFTVITPAFLGGPTARKIGAQVIAGVRAKELNDARSLGVSDLLAIDDDTAIERFRLGMQLADTVGGQVAAKLIVKVRQSGSFGYASTLPENAAAKASSWYRHGPEVNTLKGSPVQRTTAAALLHKRRTSTDSR